MSLLRATFGSLTSRNYRLYCVGQTVSVTGTWMQRVGQAWLVLELTGSGTLLGITVALQFLPILLAGPWGGLLADRLDKRALLMWTQVLAGVLALALGVLIATGAVRFWMVLAIAFGLGMVTALDNPVRHSFVLDMVGPEQITNAVTLNSVIVNATKVVGPALAGVVIASAGLAPSFLLNALSYFTFLVALALMDVAALDRAPVMPRARGQLREGIRYVRATPELAGPLLLVGVVGMLAYEFQVVLPLLARYTFEGDAQTFGIMNSAMGLGAVIGGLAAASWLRPSSRALVLAGLSFGGIVVLTALAPTLELVLATLFVTGATSIVFVTISNSLLQLRAAASMRGRVLALWGVAMMGTTAVGGPFVGWVAETAGPRAALALGGIATVCAAAALSAYLHRAPEPGAGGAGAGSP